MQSAKPHPRVESVGFTALIPTEKGRRFYRFGFSESEDRMIRHVSKVFGVSAMTNIHVVVAARMEDGRIHLLDETGIKLLKGVIL